ncbi:Bug family tripartite tricarboxylate transporter substrate binding protein [Tardiphaga sp. 866_E4_N2_1]|uniref:Bug family tripartite tricarboxylate transporter substrate binding protein n=1 Tax=unclassified Tardiphaga TaxID=2631404 RepID=UPI003F206136
MINPFAPGDPNDVVARLLAQRILGRPVIVENVGGAGGMNGASRVAKADPDGYTFLQGTVGTQAQNQTLYKKPAYNSVTDFAPVGMVIEAPLVLVARNDLPTKDLKQFVACAKANKDKMQYGSAGTGSAIHLGCALTNMGTGIDVLHVPYKGANPAMQDLMSGRIDYLCDITTTAKAQTDANTVEPIDVLSKQRSPPTTGGADGHRERLRYRCLYLQRILSAEGHARQHRQQAQSGDHRSPRGAKYFRDARGRGPGHCPGKASSAGLSRPIPEERNRQMGDAHQGQRRHHRIGDVVPQRSGSSALRAMTA